MFHGLGRDLVRGGRSLLKARAFTVVCVVSLGIGMVPVIAIPYVSRLTTLTPPGVNTAELVELVTTTVGPRLRRPSSGPIPTTSTCAMPRPASR